MAAQRLLKDDRLVLVEQYTVLTVPINRSRQHLALYVSATPDQLFGPVKMLNALNVLLDDRALVEIRSDIVRCGANNFYSAIESLVIGFCPFKAW